jgi:hypothetical protein
MSDSAGRERTGPPESEPIPGEVAAIIDEREILLNVGKNQGVQPGMRFAVIGKIPVMLKTGQTVHVDYPKTVVKIVRLQDDDFSIGRTFRTIRGRKGVDFSKPLSSVSYGPSVYEILSRDIPDRVETIMTGNQETILGSSPKSRVTKIGDPVRQLVGDEFHDDDL